MYVRCLLGVLVYVHVYLRVYMCMRVYLYECMYRSIHPSIHPSMREKSACRTTDTQTLGHTGKHVNTPADLPPQPCTFTVSPDHTKAQTVASPSQCR
jgi:hypothetical protein